MVSTNKLGVLQFYGGSKVLIIDLVFFTEFLL